jgi:hypothetical protein
MIHQRERVLGAAGAPSVHVFVLNL